MLDKIKNNFMGIFYIVISILLFVGILWIAFLLTYGTFVVLIYFWEIGYHFLSILICTSQISILAVSLLFLFSYNKSKINK